MEDYSPACAVVFIFELFTHGGLYESATYNCLCLAPALHKAMQTRKNVASGLSNARSAANSAYGDEQSPHTKTCKESEVYCHWRGKTQALGHANRLVSHNKCLCSSHLAKDPRAFVWQPTCTGDAEK
jgi:hypothetical protein